MAKKKKSTPKKLPQQEAPLLGKNGGYVKDPRYALGKMGRYAGLTEFEEDEHPEPEPAAVYPSDLKWITEEAKTRHIGRTVNDQQSQLEGERRRLTALLQASSDIARERGIDIRSDVRIIERRIAAIDRKLGLREAA